MDRLFTYARMRRDEDNTVSKYQILADKALHLAVESESRLSFVEPEILSLSKEELLDFLSRDEKLELYKHYINDLLRMKGHILDTAGEKMLADAGEMAQAPGDIFRMLDNADMRFPIIKDSEGNEIELTRAIYRFYGEHRNVRKRRLRGCTKPMANLSIPSHQCYPLTSKIYFTKSRKFNSCLGIISVIIYQQRSMII